MATSWEQIYAAAMIPIDDVRLQEQLQISPALFNRRMSLYVTTAMPLLSRPPELLAYLKDSMEEPEYDDFEWTSIKASSYFIFVEFSYTSARLVIISGTDLFAFRGLDIAVVRISIANC